MSQRVLDKVFFTVLACQILFSLIQFCIIMEFEYAPIVHGAIISTSFSPDFSLISVMFAFFVAWSIIMFTMRKQLILFPLISFVLYPFLDLEVLILFTSLQCVVASLWFYDCLAEVKIKFLDLFIVLEGVALFYWVVLLPLGILVIRPIILVEEAFFYLFGRFTAVLFAILLVGWVVNLLPRFRGWIDKLGLSDRVPVVFPTSKIRLVVLLLVFISVLSSSFPYLPQLNSEEISYGRDFPRYLLSLEKYGYDLDAYFSGSSPARLVLHLLVLALNNVLGLDFTSGLALLPVILNPLIAVTAFYLAREFFMDDEVASWCGFFTATGFQPLIGMASYFVSNMLGFVELYSSYYFLKRASRVGLGRDVVLSLFFSVLLYFTHPWTFLLCIAPLGLLWLFKVLRDQRMRLDDPVFVYLVIGGVVVVASVLLGYSGGVSVASGDLTSRLATDLRSVRFGNLYGGFFRIFPLLVFSIIGYYLVGNDGDSKHYLHFFMFLSTVLYLVGNEILKSRVLYNLPIGFFAAFGYVYLRGLLGGSVRRRVDLYIVLLLLVNLFRSVINLV